MRTLRKKSGFVLVLVLVCLAVVMTVIASTMQASLRMRQEVRTHKHRLQAELLCEAGFLRAEKRLTDDALYQGEIWQPELPELADQQFHVEIRFEDSPANTSKKQLFVTATVGAFGTDSMKSIQLTQTRERP